MLILLTPLGRKLRKLGCYPRREKELGLKRYDTMLLRLFPDEMTMAGLALTVGRSTATVSAKLRRLEAAGVVTVLGRGADVGAGFAGRPANRDLPRHMRNGCEPVF